MTNIVHECTVQLVSFSGDDLLVVNAARTSFDKQSDELNEKDIKLINFLAREKHVLPFRHPQITLRIEAPIFVLRQLDKHQVGFSTSEISRRYITSEPTFFFPKEWRKKADNVKQGSSDETVEDVYWPDSVKFAEAQYFELMKRGVCPEQARMILPQNMMTTQIKTGSLLGWHHLYQLRADPHAQKEIRDLAELIRGIIQPLYPISWKALSDN